MTPEPNLANDVVVEPERGVEEGRRGPRAFEIKEHAAGFSSRSARNVASASISIVTRMPSGIAARLMSRIITAAGAEVPDGTAPGASVPAVAAAFWNPLSAGRAVSIAVGTAAGEEAAGTSPAPSASSTLATSELLG